MKKRCILLVIIFFISIIILSVNSNNKYLVKEESLATYIDGEKTDSFPAKGTVAFSKAKCDNNTNIEWDNDNWGLYVTNLSNKVKCNIYFKTGENAVTKITNLASSDTTNMASDDPDNNIRYIGANPNNYVYFNCSDYANQTSETCEKWRIIGVFNNIEKEDGTKENLIKIVRDESILWLSYDTSSSDVNEGLGVNDWSKSDMMHLLNAGYELKKVGGSLYWNATGGSCYHGQNNNTNDCDFTTTGLKNTRTKNYIQSVVWNLGGSVFTNTANEFYQNERSTNVYENNSTKWVGKVALMYPSDYWYATNGGSKVSRTECLVQSLKDATEECVKNNWTGYKIQEWTLTPHLPTSTEGFCMEYGFLKSCNSYYGRYIKPALFLKSNILITSGDGSSNTPYQLGL